MANPDLRNETTGHWDHQEHANRAALTSHTKHKFYYINATEELLVSRGDGVYPLNGVPFINAAGDLPSAPSEVYRVYMPNATIPCFAFYDTTQSKWIDEQTGEEVI